jgi:hypothetical protein
MQETVNLLPAQRTRPDHAQCRPDRKKIVDRLLKQRAVSPFVEQSCVALQQRHVKSRPRTPKKALLRPRAALRNTS